ncbi:Aste57867_11407 [Aphanomyces stellatus]|uniref:Aste57867_11407 protein n=1 Tax=Aphanomyces stellatus TaxID=120398 RepID=A0A485KSW4_9STRA|nr:hypothetical protein As57867_011365 [Aphanomyces stellatus]VFT88268.1 Aste57867_11407 [Aphanomyces stellatus]
MSSPCCVFCILPATFDGKCAQHRYRRRCSVAHCTNQTYARNLCVQHGGKRQCRFAGCQGNARQNGFCCRHSQDLGQQRVCKHDGCTKAARSRDLCVAHSGGRQCNVDGCTKYIRHNGLCLGHFRIEEASRTPLPPLSPVTDYVAELSDEEVDILSFLMEDESKLEMISSDFWFDASPIVKT